MFGLFDGSPVLFCFSFTIILFGLVACSHVFTTILTTVSMNYLLVDMSLLKISQQLVWIIYLFTFPLLYFLTTACLDYLLVYMSFFFLNQLIVWIISFPHLFKKRKVFIYTLLDYLLVHISFIVFFNNGLIELFACSHVLYFFLLSLFS